MQAAHLIYILSRMAQAYDSPPPRRDAHQMYDKHTGNMIRFTNLCDVNNHLLAFEHSIEENKDEEDVLAKSMMVFMVRG